MGDQISFLEAIKSGDLARVLNELERDAQLVHANDPSGVSAILIAAYYGQQKILDALLSYAPPLDIFEAVTVGALERVREMVAEAPGCLNGCSADGHLPLGLAAFFGRLEILKFLIASGADVNAASQNPMRVRPVHSAAAHRQSDIGLAMARELLTHGANVNHAQQGGWTPLHQAAAHGYLDHVKLMLEHGADPMAISEDGKTPVQLAAAGGHEAVLKLLSNLD